MEKRIKKIAVIGAESTGKTQLCEALAEHFDTTWVPEFARTYFNDSDIYNYSLADLEKIAARQYTMEKDLLKKARGILFCDTAILTLKIWAELEFGTCPETILKIMDENPYDFYLITNNEVEWEQDPLRLNKFSRDRIFTLNEEAVIKSGVSFAVVDGTGRERIQSAIRWVETFLELQKLV